jgi:hypothetical protein
MWCSILVVLSAWKTGIFDPLIGTSMKLLVLAFDAQLGVGAGRFECRAAIMACGMDPSFFETYICM